MKCFSLSNLTQSMWVSVEFFDSLGFIFVNLFGSVSLSTVLENFKLDICEAFDSGSLVKVCDVVARHDLVQLFRW